MNLSSLFETCWKQAKNHLLPLLLLTLSLLAATVFSLGILGPVAMAGYYSSLLRMIRYDRSPQPMDVFSEFRLFLPLSVFSLILVVLVGFGYMVFILPGILMTLAAAFACLYMLPLLVDRQPGVTGAIRESIAMIRKGPLSDHLMTMIIVTGIQIIGGSVILGTLVSTPLAGIFLLNVYDVKSGLGNVR